VVTRYYIEGTKFLKKLSYGLNQPQHIILFPQYIILFPQHIILFTQYIIINTN